MPDGANSADESFSRGNRSAQPPFAVVVTPLQPDVNLRPLIRALAGQTGLDGECVTVFAAVGDRLGAGAAAFEAVADGAVRLHLFEGKPARVQTADDRRVLEAAAYHLQRYARGADPVMLVVDAEAIPAADWIASNLRALRAGADVVCGSPVPSLRREVGRPSAVVEALVRYRRLAVRLEDVLDPVEWDPAPRHGDESGASLAFRLSRLVSAGGVPDVPADLRAHLLARLRQSGDIIRHCPRTRIFVPPRLLVGFEAERQLPGPELPVSVSDPEHLEQTFRHRAYLRAQLARRYARLAPADGDRAVRSHLALVSAAVPVSPRAVPVEQACAALRRRLDELGAPCARDRSAARLARAGTFEDERPWVW